FSIWHDRPCDLDYGSDVDQLAVAFGHSVGGAEEYHVSIVIEIRNRADAPGSISPKADDVEIGRNMLQYLRAHDGVIVTGIRLRVKCIAAEEQLRTSGTICCIADRYRAEIEPAIGAAVLPQDHFRQKAVA